MSRWITLTLYGNTQYEKLKSFMQGWLQMLNDHLRSTDRLYTIVTRFQNWTSILTMGLVFNYQTTKCV